MFRPSRHGVPRPRHGQSEGLGYNYSDRGRVRRSRPSKEGTDPPSKNAPATSRGTDAQIHTTCRSTTRSRSCRRRSNSRLLWAKAQMWAEAQRRSSTRPARSSSKETDKIEPAWTDASWRRVRGAAPATPSGAGRRWAHNIEQAKPETALVRDQRLIPEALDLAKAEQGAFEQVLRCQAVGDEPDAGPDRKDRQEARRVFSEPSGKMMDRIAVLYEQAGTAVKQAASGGDVQGAERPPAAGPRVRGAVAVVGVPAGCRPPVSAAGVRTGGCPAAAGRALRHRCSSAAAEPDGRHRPEHRPRTARVAVAGAGGGCPPAHGIDPTRPADRRHGRRRSAGSARLAVALARAGRTNPELSGGLGGAPITSPTLPGAARVAADRPAGRSTAAAPDARSRPSSDRRRWRRHDTRPIGGGTGPGGPGRRRRFRPDHPDLTAAVPEPAPAPASVRSPVAAAAVSATVTGRQRRSRSGPTAVQRRRRRAAGVSLPA